MAYDAAIPSSSARASERAAMTLVDCDVHPLIPIEDVFAKMTPRAMRDIFLSGHITGTSREFNRNLHPSGALRLDAAPPKGGHAGSDIDFLIEDWIERANVSAALMSPVQATAVVPWANDQAVNEYLAALNDLLLVRCYGRDKRLKILISVNPHDLDSAVREVERLADVPGVVGINVPLATVNPGSAAYFKLYEIAADRGLPVCFHPTGAEGNLSAAPTFGGGIVRSYAEHHSMLAHSGQAAVAAIAASGALARFPKLRIVLVEFGFSWVAPLMWRLDTAWHRHGGADATMERPPSSYVYDQVRFTTQPFDEADDPRHLAALLDAMQADRTLLFSSDYPHWDTDDPAVVFKARVPAKLRPLVAAETAIETFGDRLWS